MADDPKKIEDALKKIEKLNQELKRLGGDAFTDINKAIESFGGGLQGAETVAKTLNSDIEDLRDNFGSIASTLKNIVQDLKGAPNPVKETTRAFNKLENLTRQISDHKKNENVLSVKQLTNVKKQTAAEVERLKAQQKLLDKNSEAYKEINNALNDKEGFLKDINKLVEEELETEKKIQKTLGLTGQAFKGIVNTLQKIGVESEAIEDINKSMREAAKNGNGFNVMGAAIKGTFNAIKDSLNDPAVQVTLFLKTFKTLYEVGTKFSQRTADIARNMGINTQQAHEYNKALIQAFKTSREQAASVKAFEEANANINDHLGTSVVFSKDILETQTALVKRAGLTTDEAARLAELSFVNGQTQEEIYDSVGKQNKGILSNRKVLGQVLKVSGQLAAQYKNNPKLLAQAVIQANKLGLTLEQTKKISEGLLNFEDSISAELEAELLTGKDLNLEKARYLALQGKSAEAAEEISKQVGSSAEFSRMNVIQQEALAKAAGMSVDELADSLVKREALQRLQSEEFKRTGIMLSNEEAATKLKEQQMSASEKMAASMEALKDALASVIAGPLGKMVEMVAGLFKRISQSPIGKFVLGAAGGIGAAIAAVGSALIVGRGIINSFKGKPSGRPADPIYTVSEGGMGGTGGGGGSIDLPSRGTKTGGIFKTLSKLAGGKKTMLGRGLRNVAATSMKRGGLTGQIAKMIPGLSKILPGAGAATASSAGGGAAATGMLGKAGGMLGKVGGVAGKLAAPAVALAQTGKGLFDFFGDKRNRATGVGGFLENLGGTGMNILDTATFGLTKLATNGTGISIPGMDTDDVASARAIFHASGRDPDDSRYPISTDNKQLINDILNNPAAYPEGIVDQAKEVDIKKLAVGGIVTKPTNALVGEAGAEAVIPLDKLMAEFREMRAILTQMANREGTVYLDGTKVGTAMAMSTYKTQ